jgi:hypothetical protein
VTCSTEAKWWYAIEHWKQSDAHTPRHTPSRRRSAGFGQRGYGIWICLAVCTYHGKVKVLLLLLLQLGERGDRSHFVRFEALRVRARIVHLYHARADIHTDELCDIRRERTRDLA